ncbi:unnamed protein product [Dibothriocephalus latus]|uniref:imidazolonepropionase n=1 Tax=Dibothriocephalus latus TaxID=60516 RepID=A0A3P7L735_DIBLA|nr:unnamed protein product [Dibothriocephalus latus]
MATLLRNISEIVHVTRNRKLPYMVDGRDIFSVSGGQDYLDKRAIILDSSDGNIISFGLEERIVCPTHTYAKVIDCQGGTVLPGFIDAHAYPIWEGDRVSDLVHKQAAGALSLEMQETGDGIIQTAEITKTCLDNVLYESCRANFRNMLKKGTTTVECKTGYGITWENEERLLRILTRLKRELPIDLSITFYAASTTPKNMTTEEFVTHIVEEQIPALKKLMDTGEVCVQNIDVRCKEGRFCL